jgi:competence protein ComEC
VTEPVDAPPLDARLVPSAILCWFVCLVAFVLGASWAAVCAGIGAAVCVMTVLVARRRSWTTVATMVVAAGALGSCMAVGVGIRAAAVESNPLRDAAVDGRTVTITGTVADDPRVLRSSFAPTAIVGVDMSSVRIGADALAVGGRVVVFGPAQSWASAVVGQSITVRGRAALPQRRDLTVAVVRSTGPLEVTEKPVWFQRWAHTVRERLAVASHDALEPDAGGLLPGIVVGDTSALSPDVVDAFTVAGLTHLTAVSGANFTYLIGAVLIAARVATVGPRTTTVVAAVVLVAFVVIARPSPSVLRAAVMGSIGLLAFVTGRRKHALPALAAAVIVLLAVDPALAVGFGFALSVTATAALILVAPVLTRRFEKVLPGPVAAAVAVACAAHAVTAPIVAALAGSFSVVAVVANVLVAPVVGPITVIGAGVAVVAVVYLPAAEVLARAAGPPLWWLLTVADESASLPFASVAVPSGLVGAVVVGVGVLGVAALFQLCRTVVARSGRDFAAGTPRIATPRSRRRGASGGARGVGDRLRHAGRDGGSGQRRARGSPTRGRHQRVRTVGAAEPIIVRGGPRGDSRGSGRSG